MIGVEANRIVYRGDGITTSFPYTFTVFEKADIVVTLVDKERKKKTLTSDYFIDMDKKKLSTRGMRPEKNLQRPNGRPCFRRDGILLSKEKRK